MRAVGLRSAVAILIAGTGVGLAVGSANAETAALAEREAPDSADSGVRDATPGAEQSDLRYQQRVEWWAHAREVLFSDVQLSAEQSRAVDAIIETQLVERRRSAELRAELDAAKEQADRKRSAALYAEIRALRARRRGPHECMEEMRALLSEEQRPIFDMNRARLAAEGQETQKERRRRRRQQPGAEVKAE